MDRKELKERSKEQLDGQWGAAALVMLIYLLIITAIGFIPIIGPAASTILSPIFGFGLVYYSLKIAQDEVSDIKDLFAGFSSFGPILIAAILMSVFISLWSLLFVIPGIIATYRYSFTFLILADEPGLSATEAIARSKRLTEGYKMDIFVLQLSFIGWSFLAGFTCGIGMLWLIPYIQVSMANYYIACKEANDGYMDAQYVDV